MPALDRAFPLADRPHRAVGIGHHLDLDVVAGGQVALAEHRRVAERGLRPRAGRRRLRVAAQLIRRTTRIPRPPPPADALTSTGSWPAVTVSGSSSSSTGTPAAAIIFLDSILEPIARTASTGGPIQVSPAACTAAREFGVLREESVAGVHRVGAGRAGRGDDGVGVADSRWSCGSRTRASASATCGASASGSV